MKEDQEQAIRLGKVLRRRRQALGLSARHLAQRAGLSGSYVGFIESGRNRRPSVQVIAQLAAALDVTMDDLAREAGLPIASGSEAGPALMQRVWPRLHRPERETLVEIGESLVRLQDRYEPTPIRRVAERGPGLEKEDVDITGQREAAFDQELPPAGSHESEFSPEEEEPE